jgi:hypothetical protein
MTITLHDLTVPAILRGLAALSAILDKGRAYADENGIAHAELLDARLYADMAPLTAQIQRVSDTAKGAMVRIGGVENVAMADVEASFEELQARISRTIEFVKAVPREAIDGKEDAKVVLTTPGGDIPFTGRSFVTGFVLPNLYFHITTTYAILRMKGVPVGKLDYLGSS